MIATNRLPLQGSAFLLDVDADDGEGEAILALLAREAVRRSQQPKRAPPAEAEGLAIRRESENQLATGNVVPREFRRVAIEGLDEDLAPSAPAAFRTSPISGPVAVTSRGQPS